jgi:hypothetical protein
MDSETGRHRVIVTDPKVRQSIRLVLPDIDNLLDPGSDQTISMRFVNKSEILPCVKHWCINCLAQTWQYFMFQEGESLTTICHVPWDFEGLVVVLHYSLYFSAAPTVVFNDNRHFWSTFQVIPLILLLRIRSLKSVPFFWYIGCQLMLYSNMFATV